MPNEQGGGQQPGQQQQQQRGERGYESMNEDQRREAGRQDGQGAPDEQRSFAPDQRSEDGGMSADPQGEGDQADIRRVEGQGDFAQDDEDQMSEAGREDGRESDQQR